MDAMDIEQTDFDVQKQDIEIKILTVNNKNVYKNKSKKTNE